MERLKKVELYKEKMLNKQTILIVSADSPQIHYLWDWLTSAGYQVYTIDLGSQAIKMIQKEKPNLIVLNWKLPDLNSLAVIRDIRSQEDANKLPIILVGDLREEDRLLCLETGADLCLEEALPSRLFIAWVRALTRRSSYN